MTDLADLFAKRQPSEIETRILNQSARELLLAQSSDWAFQIYQGTTVEYSTRRFESHIYRFDLLAKMLEAGSDVSSPTPEQLDLLTEIENRDNIFSEIDFRVYSSLSR
jgi:1,4-alpha-glucan branching enzyme